MHGMRQSGEISRSAPEVVVETWVMAFDAGRWRALPAFSHVMHGDDHPHSYASAVAADRSIVADVVHSTSWRMVAGRVVLTYVVVTSDELGPSGFDVHRGHDHWLSGTLEDHVPGGASTDATAAPEFIQDGDVLHHAVHHLALLARTNPSVMASLSAEALDSLRPLAPAGAGVLPAYSTA